MYKERADRLHLPPAVSVDDLPRNASDHWPSIPPLPAPSPRPHRTAVLGIAPPAIHSSPADLQIERKQLLRPTPL